MTSPSQTKSRTPRPKRSKAPQRVREQSWIESGAVVAGVDEVGRGAWAGPLVSAAVILDHDYRIQKIRDSKALPAKAREELSERILERARGVGIGIVTIKEMNEYGFTWALRQAGIRAVRELSEPPDQVLLDGHHDYFAGEFACETIINGDAKELCIAAASVVAKVHRDELMDQLSKKHPEYGFATNKGYGTAAHQQALKKHGPTAVHRAQWKPIQKLLQQPLGL